MENLPHNHVETNDEFDAPRAGGLPVRTDLRAGLSWDDLDGQAKDLWSQLSDAVSNITGSTSDSSTTTGS